MNFNVSHKKILVMRLTDTKNEVVPSVLVNKPGNSLIQVSSPKKLIVFVPFACNWYTQLSWWPSEEEVSDSAIFNIASTKLGIVPGMKGERINLDFI